ncbi:MAG: leucine-rich repeat domain-containing protein [Clostridia bacterium]|nr:leucine-rich repeat domain-containing protein [Clostridia bacterium]
MKNNSQSTVYASHLSRFRGVDFSLDDISLSPNRFCNLKNMWKDWQSNDGLAVETFPGYRLFGFFGDKVFGIYSQKTGGVEYLIIHAGNKLYRFPAALRHQPNAIKDLEPICAKLPAQEGCGFQSGDFLYLLTGGQLYRIDNQGACLSLLEENELPYVPIAFYNGAHYEQRNLLTNEVREVSTAESLEEKQPAEYDSLVFVPLPASPGCCAVKAGKPSSLPLSLTIPSSAEIDGETYTVTGIAGGGFCGFSNLFSVTLPDTITEIGAYAFAECISLTEVHLPSSLQYIWHHAFWGCVLLHTVSLNEGLISVGEAAFGQAECIRYVYYPKDQESYSAISFFEGSSPFPASAQICLEAEAPIRQKKLLLAPVYTPALRINRVLLGEEEITAEGSAVYGTHASYTYQKQDGYIQSVCVFVADDTVLAGRAVTLQLEASPTQFNSPLGFKAFGESAQSLSGKDAVLGCQAVGEYDGRIFFTGNPKLPNTVFFSSPDETGYNNPLYIGNLNYFNDGLSSVPNRALLGTGDMLMVMKEEGAGRGGIFYHTAESTSHSFAPRIYPAVSGLAGMGTVSGALNFRDDPVFLTKNGLFAVERQAVNLERSLCPRSSNVNLKLCREDLSSAKMAVFEGYLCILTKGNVYLADSRETFRHPKGSTEYEWYFLTGIGHYQDDKPLYRYAETLPASAEKESIFISPKSGQVVEGEVYSLMGETGEMLYYVQENGQRYGVDTDGERTGGVFFPATTLCVGEDTLYFATESGAIGCFNTDKRGKALYRTKPSPLFYQKDSAYFPLASVSEIHSEDELQTMPLFALENGTYTEMGTFPVYQNGNLVSLAEEIEEGRQGRIPAYYYTYAFHRFPSGCATAKDNGGMPHLRKNTLPGTVALRLKLFAPTHFSVDVSTDRSPWHRVEECRTDAADLSDADFSAFSFDAGSAVTLPIREKERRWCEKQYAFFDEVFRSPFGIYGLSYSHQPAGKLQAPFS